MYQIRTIQKEKMGHAGYAVVIPSRVKKNEPSFLPPGRAAERPNIPARILAQNSPKRFSKNSFGVFSRAAAFALIGFFFCNPVLDVYADELPIIIPGDPPAVIAGETIIPEPSPVSEEITAPGISEPVLGTATTTLPAEEDVTSLEADESAEVTPPSVSDVIPDAEIATTTDEVLPVAETLVATSTDESIVEEAPHEEKQASGTEEVVESDQETAATSSAEEVIEELELPEEQEDSSIIETQNVAPIPQIQVTHVTEQKYLFRENECTRLEDGGFYCAPPEMANEAAFLSTTLPRAYMESDAINGGSKEIFFEDASGKVKITDNTYDDDAPVYDRQSGLILWHALMKGRFQIMLYDRNSSTTKQITTSEYNNTDPKIRGKSAVWQAWVNNNWEIFYTKDVTADSLKIEQITTNNQPDMFPIISDSFVTWQSFFGGSWHVFVYSLENGQISQINQPEAGRYENPRFALLFENRKENGEIETVGYDVASGKQIPINAAHIPDPAAKSSGGEEDKTVPLPSGQTSTSTTALKNPGKDDEGHES